MNNFVYHNKNLHLSRNIDSMKLVNFMLYPPESKTTPLPTNAIDSFSLGFPINNKINLKNLIKVCFYLVI